VRKGGAQPYWTEEKVVASLLQFSKIHGRKPAADDTKRFPGELPSAEAIRRVCGYWSNAMILAFGESWPQGGQFSLKDEDTALVVQELARGRSLTELGAERGISGQALGRRVRRWKERGDILAEMGSHPTSIISSEGDSHGQRPGHPRV
jgi:hypothetical protein